MAGRRVISWLAAMVAVAAAVSWMTLTLSQHSSTGPEHRVAASASRAAARAAASAVLSAQASASMAASNATNTPAGGPHDIMFVGGSYTAGLGASEPTRGYAYLAAREIGWRAQVYGVSGTGYLNPGPHGDGRFETRIAQLPLNPQPGIIVIQGGRNDVAYPSALLRAAVVRTVDVTRHRFAHAMLVFLGPIPGQLPVPRQVLRVESVLQAAARTTHVKFIDPIAQGWITPHNEVALTGHVPGHPDNAGYAYISQRLVDDLRGYTGRSI